MKNIVYIATLFLIIAGLSGCEKEIKDFDGEEGVYFYVPRHRRHLPAAAPRKRGIGGHRLNRIQDETPYAKIPRSGGRAARSGGLRL